MWTLQELGPIKDRDKELLAPQENRVDPKVSWLPLSGSSTFLPAATEPATSPLQAQAMRQIKWQHTFALFPTAVSLESSHTHNIFPGDTSLSPLRQITSTSRGLGL